MPCAKNLADKKQRTTMTKTAAIIGRWQYWRGLGGRFALLDATYAIFVPDPEAANAKI